MVSFKFSTLPLITFSLAFAWMLSACVTLPPPPLAQSVSQESQAGVPAPELAGVEWWLLELRTPDGAPLTPPDPSAYTVYFGQDGRFEGKLACNLLSGDYTIEAGKLRFGPLVSTLAACPEDGVSDVYAQALAQVNGYTFREGRLVVSFGPNGGELVYAAGPVQDRTPELVAGEWRLQEMHTPEGQVLRPGANEQDVVRFERDAAVYGQADCNQFRGAYTADDGRLQVGPLMSTRAACPPDSLGERFVAALGAASGFSFDDQGRLRIAYDSGGGVLVFARP